MKYKWQFFWRSFFYLKFGQLESRNVLMAKFYNIASSTNHSSYAERFCNCLSITYQDTLYFSAMMIMNQHPLWCYEHLFTTTPIKDHHFLWYIELKLYFYLYCKMIYTRAFTSWTVMVLYNFWQDMSRLEIYQQLINLSYISTNSDVSTR